ADHGICPNPEASRAAGRPAERVMARTVFAGAEEHLRKVFGEPSGSKSRWIETANEGGAYLNDRLIEARGLSIDAVAAELAAWLKTRPFVDSVYTWARLQGGPPAGDEIAARVKKSYFAERNGDVLWVPKEY